MGRKPRPARNSDTVISVSITFAEEDAKQLRDFMNQEDMPNANTAVRTIVASVVHSDRKWWATMRAQRKAQMFEFRRRLYEEWLGKLRELNQSVADELVLLEANAPLEWSNGSPDANQT